MSIENIPTSQLREAALAWRRHQAQESLHHSASGWFKWLLPAPNMSLHDQIDDLIDEIERLRIEHRSKAS